MPAKTKKQSQPKSTPADSPLDNAMRFERALLACIYDKMELIAEVECDLAADFLLSDHRKLWQSALNFHAEGKVLDVLTWSEHAKVAFDYVSGLQKDYGNYLLPKFKDYVLGVQKAAQERRFVSLCAELGNSSPDDRPRILEQIQTCATSEIGVNWRSIFHTVEEFDNAPPLQFAIDGFLQEAGITFIAGLPTQGKTLVMLSMAQALLDSEPLFGYFKVPRPSSRVIYLIPEATLTAFKARIKLFHLEEYFRSDRLLIRTLSSKEDVALTDSRLLKAVKGADVFLDTAVRFMEGTENDVEFARKFAGTLFALLTAGARTITGAHHAPKSFTNQDYMCLENVVRGSGDLGASISTAWGLRQIDTDKNRVYVQNIKPRDFQPCQPFIIEGRPHINETGRFRMTDFPGFAGELQSYLPKHGAPNREEIEQQTSERFQRARELKNQGLSVRDIAQKLGVTKSTAQRILDKLESGSGANGSAKPDSLI